MDRSERVRGEKARRKQKKYGKLNFHLGFPVAFSPRSLQPFGSGHRASSHGSGNGAKNQRTDYIDDRRLSCVIRDSWIFDFSHVFDGLTHVSDGLEARAMILWEALRILPS